MNPNRYVIKSLELHLFFARIMKEHALFLRAGFTPADPSFSEKAHFYMEEFEKLLSCAVTLADGLVSREVLCSGETVTEFTAQAERQTACFTGIPIDGEITRQTLRLKPRDCKPVASAQLRNKVRRLNHTALTLIEGLIGFKELVLQRVLGCEMFTLNYPLLIEHILREAKLYRKYVEMLEREGNLPDRSVKDMECFWNQIMMEHAQFIRGLLDPCETELMDTAGKFAEEYCNLLHAGRSGLDKAITAASLEQTIKLRDFKAAGTKGIAQCEIRSVILPLLADHVLREANHYIRLLQS